MLDEGAGELDSKAFHERLEDHAIELGFQVGRDYFHGSLRALNEHRDEAFDRAAQRLGGRQQDFRALGTADLLGVETRVGDGGRGRRAQRLGHRELRA